MPADAAAAVVSRARTVRMLAQLDCEALTLRELVTMPDVQAPARRCCSGSKRRERASGSPRRGACALHRGADAGAGPAGRCRARAQASRPRRHLHHRPQRQLHERLRGALQLLRVLPAGRLGRRLRAWGSTRSSARSTRPSASAAGSSCCRAGTTPTCPSAWYEDLFRAVKARYPDFKLHALSPPEVLHISRMAQLPVPDGDRAAHRRRPRQHSRWRRRDPRRSRAQAAALLRQGDGRRVAGRDARGASRRACARPRR